jgi:4-amino-4-deoxy-L-arabinose transferase-like glycosyltransferase
MLVWLCIVVLCVWFGTLDARHLLKSDEGRYAEIAREMFATGDWVTIRYNGLKYFEKPPFHLWMTALAYHAFGVGDWQARLWGAVSGMVGLIMTALAAQRWFGPRVGWLTAMVLLATPTWNLGSHFNSLDMSVSAALACVLATLLIAQHPSTDPRARRRWMIASWSAMGVAVLTKGLIGIALPGLVLIAYTIVSRDWQLWRRLNLLIGALWFSVIVAPWFVLVSLRNPEFASFFFIHEHWQRYTSTVHQRSAPFWYFVPQLLIGFLPWLGLTRGMHRAVKDDLATHNSFKPLLLLCVWPAVIFVFFSLSGSKLPGYIIPLFPALAILAALALDRLTSAAWGRQLLGMSIVATLALMGSPLVGQMSTEHTPIELYKHYAYWIAAACAVATVGLVWARRFNRLDSTFASIVAASLVLFVATTIGLVGHETLGRSTSGIDLIAPIEAVLTPEMPIYSVRLLDHTLPFYLRRTTIMVERPDELEFGTEQEPQKWLPDIGAFEAAWASGTHAVAIMSHSTFTTLQVDRATMYPIAEDSRRVVVANFPYSATATPAPAASASASSSASALLGSTALKHPSP